MATTFYPPHIGGVEYHVDNVSRELVARGHRITVLTADLPGEKSLPEHEASNGIEVFRSKTFFPSGKLYPSLSSQGVMLNIGSTITRIVKEKDIDVIHAHGHHYYTTWRALGLAKKLGLPAVLSLHGLYALKPSDPIAQVSEGIFNRTVFTWELDQATAVIGLTPTITGYAKKYGAQSKYYTIPNGVNRTLFEENKKHKLQYRRKFNIPKDKIVILFRGRFADIKGVLELARAAKIIVGKNPDVFFLFVGGGSLAPELATILKSINKNSQIIGWTPVDELQELYIASDIFVLPSKAEALPLTILEAMAANLYIVATPVGGVPDVLKNYPFKLLINQADQEKISETLLSVIEQKTYLISNSPDHSYLDSYDWSKIAERIEKVYLEITG